MKVDKRQSRRDFFKAGLAAGVGAALPVSNAQAKGNGNNESEDDGLTFVNGRIHTMDDQNRVVGAVAIRNGRFVSVGNASNPGPGERVIDLRGRTVVPGLIESHTHFVSLANRPGYHVAQWELASNIAEVLASLAARRPSVPAGQFITAMGAGTPRMFAELRLPTLAEIDAAVPDRPVFLYQGGGGPARTNTLGKQFFETATAPLAGPCVVGADGSLATVAGVNHANRALYHLRIRQTFEDKKRSALDAMAYSASIGLTTNLDQTLVAKATGTLDPASLDPQPTDALFNLNHFRMYDAWLALHREDKAFIRLQINFLHNQGFIAALGDLDHQLPELRERLKNQFPFFGDDMVRTGGIGEWAAPFASPASADYPVWLESQRLVARRAGATRTPRPAATSSANIEQVVATYEAMDAGIRHQGAALGLAARGLRDAGPARPPQELELRCFDVRVPLAERRPARRRTAGRAALSTDPRERHPCRPARGRRAYRASQSLVRAALRDDRTQRSRPADQSRAADLAPASALRLHARQRLVSQSRERSRLDRRGQACGPCRARSRLLQRQRCGHAQNAPVLTVVDGEVAYDAGVI
jgi:hypothetical protein